MTGPAAPSLAETLQRAGFVIVPAALTEPELHPLRDAADAVFAQEQRSRPGIRGIVGRHEAFATLASSPAVRAPTDPVLGPQAFLVRSILFDKRPDANWDVVWHQDTSIAVSERREALGFGPWSTKDGTPHVQPPAQVLERMLTIRWHLDECTAANGALLVVPGSHLGGIIADHVIDPAACESIAHTCEVPAGGALLMRPLILHASKKVTNPTHRRIVHLEFAADPLPSGLHWASS